MNARLIGSFLFVVLVLGTLGRISAKDDSMLQAPSFDPDSLIGERSSLVDMGLGHLEPASHSVPMPNQTRLNLYATLVAVVAFVFLAFSQSGGG
jgi:hypothetical protein